jgi:parallel beta-helix repeat protein
VQDKTSTASIATEERKFVRGKNGVYWFAIAIGFILVLGSVAPVVDLDNDDFEPTVIISEPERIGFLGGTPHAPIVIDGDANFTVTALTEGWLGDGSSGTPFIIEGLDIDVGGAPGHGISINNTRVHFVIRDCYLTGASASLGSGIYLYNVTDGELINNTCTSNSYGIYLYLSDFNTVSDNTCTSNSHSGIYLGSSTSTVVSNNSCSSNTYGIYLGSSTVNTLSNNTCTSNSNIGIYLSSSASNTVVNNIATSNTWHGIRLDASASNTVVNSTCTSNTYGIYLDTSTSNTLSNNNCTSNSNRGIYLGSSTSNTLSNNNCTSNSNMGIYLSLSDFNTVSNNTCNGNDFGIYLSSSISTSVISNTFTDNTNYGVYLDALCTLNHIRWNVFMNSLSNGLDSGTGNVFYYNYWSDYTGTDANGDGYGDTPYTLTGNSDNYPLMYRPSLRWIEQPTDQSVEFEHLYHYELPILYDGPVTWSISDTTHFSIDNQGVVESNWVLPIGDYALQVNVTNIYGISITATFYVRVTVDAGNPPGWLTIPTDQSLSLGEKFDYQVIAIDPSGIDRWELNDTTHFTLSASFYFDGSTARLSNKSILEVGSYGLDISVYDVYGNKLSAVFSIIVTTTITTVTTTTTTPTTTGLTSTTPGGIDPVMTLALGAGLGGVAVFAIVMVMLRRRS